MTTHAGAAIDSTRLARALHLEVEQLGDGRFLVFGGEAMHAVDLGAPIDAVCDCNDRRYRHHVCKHELAARLSVLDVALLEGLRELIPYAAGREQTP